MSTYYSIGCERCKAQVSFVRRGSGFSWMANAQGDVLDFMQRHQEHVAELRIFSEHDERYDTYSDPDDERAFPPAHARVSGSPA